jgi:hypothetical protein
MSDSPEPPLDRGLLPMLRTCLFWVLVVLLAVVFWKTASPGWRTKNVRALMYKDFIEQVDRNNVSTRKYFLAQTTAQIRGLFREPAEQSSPPHPKEAVPGRTVQPRKQGRSIEVSPSSSGGGTAFLIHFASSFLLVAFWIFIMKRTRLERDEKS